MNYMDFGLKFLVASVFWENGKRDENILNDKFLERLVFYHEYLLYLK